MTTGNGPVSAPSAERSAVESETRGLAPRPVPRRAPQGRYTGITDAQCRALAPRSPKEPGGKPRDGSLRVAPNLDLYCDVDGHKRWTFDYTSPVTRKRRYAGLGAYPGDASLAQARAKADEFRKLIDAGRDPLDERARNVETARQAKAADALSEARREATLGKRIREFHAVRALKFKGGARSKHGKQWLADTERSLPKAMLDRPICEITKGELLERMSAVVSETGETGYRVLDRLERVWKRAVFDEVADRNIPELVKGELRELYPKAEARAHSALDFHRIPEFVANLRAFDRADAETKLALEFCILTASRTTEVRGVRWCEFDIKAASWNVPAERMKRPKPHYVALAPRALAILAEARALRPDAKPDDLVFPSRDPRKPLSEMAMLMMLRRIPTGEKRDDGEDETYSDLSTVHGFRAGFSSWAREKTRFRVDAIEAALAHREQDRVAAAYSHMAEYRKDRAALATAWAEFVASGTTKGKVIKMRARSA